MDALPVWTYEEIGRHNRADDCWLVIDDKVYDVTRFVPTHPGGNMIFLNAGRESTRLFDAYHPERVRQLLPKYLIGTVKGENVFRVKFANEQEDRALYGRIKASVMQYFKDNKMDPRFSVGMYVKTFIIMATFISFFYLSYFYFENFLLSLLCSMVVGFCSAEVGVSIQHDANHGAFHKNPSVNKVIGMSLDFVGGASSFIWKQQHVFGHHCYTNINDVDPDIRVLDPDVRRTNNMQPWQRYQIYQHLYLGFLYGLLAIKSIFVDDIKMLMSGVIGNVPVNHIHFDEIIIFFAGKGFYVFYYFVLPLVYSHYGIVRLIYLWLIAHLVTGWMLAFMFQVNHVTEDVDFYEKDTIPVGWTRSQIEGTSDWAHGSWFWTNISGGLNYQVVHHLFPWVCHMHYPAIAPIIRKICEEEGIKYPIYPTFQSALYSHYQHMKTTGKGAKAN